MLPIASALVPFVASAVLAAPQDAPAAPTWPVISQVAIDLGSAPTGFAWWEADLDIVERPHPLDPRVHVFADARELAELDSLGLSWDVIHPDVTAFHLSRFEEEADLLTAGADAGGPGSWLSPPFGQGAMGGFYTYSQVVSVLDQMTAAYPAITTDKVSVGTTWEGRQLWMVKISDNPDVDENEPEARFDSMHHAREPQSMQTTLWFMLFLLENYGTDPLATYLVDEREIYFIPVVNPDGYVYNQTTSPGGGGLWRKNRRDNGDGTVGVDLNRNYPFQWGFDNFGSSPSPSSSTYRGPSAASEPEIQGMVAFLASREFGTALSSHTYSDLWIHAWGYTSALPSNNPDYVEVSLLATLINAYTWGPASTVLYPANGVTIDQDQGVHGTMSWTPEIGGTGDGFWPQTSQIIPLAQENLFAFQTTALSAGANVRVLDTTVTDAGDLDGNFEPSEVVTFDVTVRNSGVDAAGSSVSATLTFGGPASLIDGSHDFGALASFSESDTGATPLSLQVDAGALPGEAITYSVDVSYEGLVQSFPGTLVVGEKRPFVTDTLEIDFGWTAGQPGDDATTGLWERGDPIATTSSGSPANPGDDNTAGGVNCYMTGNGGGSAGDDDVDNGKTTLLSPVFDLSGVGEASVGYARWFADLSTQDDVFLVELSNDGGGSWTTLETVATNQNQWTEVEFQVSDFLPQTADMQLRFTAADDPNNSVVEAAVDDLRVEIFDSAARFNVYGTAEGGTQIQLNVTGEAGAAYSVYLSAGTGSLTIPGVVGTVLLDINDLFLLSSGTVGGSGLGTSNLEIPNTPGLVGQQFHLQALVVSSVIEVTNKDELTVE